MTLTGVLTLTLLLASCGDDAGDYARQACAQLDTTATSSTFTDDSLKQDQAAYDKAAELSAEAAADDRQWEKLATAYSNQADLLKKVGPLALAAQRDELADKDRATFKQDADQWTTLTETVTAQCRIADAGK